MPTQKALPAGSPVMMTTRTFLSLLAVSSM